MRCDRDSFVLPPALAAARRRVPRHLRKAAAKAREIENNYIAESPVRHGKKKGNRRAGAPLGNTNAQTHGAFTAEMRLYRAVVYQAIRSARLTLMLRKMALAQWKRERSV